MRQLTSLTRFWVQKQFIRKFSNEKPWKEVSIPVPWGYIRGKWWGPTDVRPVLTIHGWQDNCGSFNTLMPLMNNQMAFLTIDLPGHGHSSRLSPGIFYHYSVYLLTIKYIKKYFQWSKVALMGHSLGGAMSNCYSMLYPDTIDFLVCIEGLKPHVNYKNSNDLAEDYDSFIKNNNFATDSREPPSYTLEEIKTKVHSPHFGSVSLDSAHHLIERNVAASKIHPGKYYFTRDPRLRREETIFWTQEVLVEGAKNVKCPVLVVKAKGGSYYEDRKHYYDVLNNLKQSSVDCEMHYIEGTHHVHLNDPQTKLADIIKKFFEKHYSEDKSKGGIIGDIVVNETENFNKEKLS